MYITALWVTGRFAPRHIPHFLLIQLTPEHQRTN